MLIPLQLLAPNLHQNRYYFHHLRTRRIPMGFIPSSKHVFSVPRSSFSRFPHYVEVTPKQLWFLPFRWSYLRSPRSLQLTFHIWIIWSSLHSSERAFCLSCSLSFDLSCVLSERCCWRRRWSWVGFPLEVSLYSWTSAGILMGSEPTLSGRTVFYPLSWLPHSDFALTFK